jgi:hypothetical protein
MMPREMPENIEYCRVSVFAASSYRRRFIATLVPNWNIPRPSGAFAGTPRTPPGGERQRP